MQIAHGNPNPPEVSYNPYFEIIGDSVQFFHFIDRYPTIRLTLKDLLASFSTRPRKHGGKRDDICVDDVNMIALFALMKTEAQRVANPVFPVELSDGSLSSSECADGLFERVFDHFLYNPCSHLY